MRPWFARVALDSHVLVALHVLILAAIGLCWAQARYEDRIFEQIVTATVSPETPERDAALALNHATHVLLGAPNSVLGERAGTGRSGPFSYSLLGLLIEGGQCGDHSLVLTRTLQLAGISARVAQLKVGDVWGAHIVVSANVDGDWVVLDPLFDHAFVTSDGRLVGVEELREDWSRYAEQLPPDYNPAYNYQAVRYTNWQKIPVVMPALRSLAERLVGPENVENFSLRVHLLNLGRVYAVGLTIVYAALLALTLLKLRARNR